MIDWVFQHLGMVVFVAIIFFFGRVVRRVAATLKDAANQTTPRRIANQDPDAAERARRVREEILRKIAERRGVPSPTGQPASVRGNLRERDTNPGGTPPVVGDLLRRARQQFPTLPPLDPFGGPPAAGRRLPRPEPATTELPEADVSTKRIQTLPPPVVREAPVFVAPSPIPVARVYSPMAAATSAAPGARGPVSPLVPELRDPAALRRAFILREILGPPVGLR